jgi:trehalose 6-phosphate phosphatase
MRHLFDEWDEVQTRLRSARKIGLFLDFDGTLVKFRSRPEQVRLDGTARHTLAALAGNPRFRVTIISGRRRDDVASRISLPTVRYLGLHGSEGRMGASASPESRHALSVVRGLLGDILSLCPGVWLEDKRDILTIHYRDTMAHVQSKAEELVRAIAGRFAKWMRMSPGKKVWELIPHELEDKGEAVRHELRAMGWLALPVYVGDDVGDEPAFEALYRGITVRVGRARRSHARYCLTNVHQVRIFLDRLRTEFA